MTRGPVPWTMRCFEKSIKTCAATAPPTFLLPTFATASRTTTRHFSATAKRSSKLGRTPLSIPAGVNITIGPAQAQKDPNSYRVIAKRTVSVSGPLGKLEYDVLPFVKLDLDLGTRQISVGVDDKEIKQQREMWGTTWAYLNNYIKGVSEGWTAVLRLVGIGFRASIEKRPAKEEYPGQDFVMLKLGFTNPVEMGVPLGVKATTPQPTRILLEGIDKETIMSFAAKMREWRKPEPYKGKGIFVNDETIKLKQKKIK